MEKKERMPMWLAVAITVVLILPAGLWMKEFSLPLWIVFSVWAEYFVFGGTLKGAKALLPAFLTGSAAALAVHSFAVFLINVFGDVQLVVAGDVAILVAYFIGFCVVVWMMKFFTALQGLGSLAYFQGIALTLGAIFTGQGAAWVGHSENSYALLIGATIVAVISCFAGVLIGWINLALVGAKDAEVEAAPVA
ncbi:MAG TPA: hypothetical protein VFE45_18970 [Coriobacteriia bacterium]|nr:hypothetical protein [Coriobacteriia bacterium]